MSDNLKTSVYLQIEPRYNTDLTDPHPIEVEASDANEEN